MHTLKNNDGTKRKTSGKIFGTNTLESSFVCGFFPSSTITAEPLTMFLSERPTVDGAWIVKRLAPCWLVIAFSTGTFVQGQVLTFAASQVKNVEMKHLIFNLSRHVSYERFDVHLNA